MLSALDCEPGQPGCEASGKGQYRTVESASSFWSELRLMADQPEAAALAEVSISPRIIWETTPTRAALTQLLRTRAMMSSMRVTPSRRPGPGLTCLPAG